MTAPALQAVTSDRVAYDVIDLHGPGDAIRGGLSQHVRDHLRLQHLHRRLLSAVVVHRVCGRPGKWYKSTYLDS